MTNQKKRFFTTLLLATLVLTSQVLHSAVKSNCHSQAQTNLENAYCDIMAKKPNTNLPSFLDFQKNDPKMQYLLLKNPAKKLQITLPKPKKTKLSKKRSPSKTNTYNTNVDELTIEKRSPKIRTSQQHQTPPTSPMSQQTGSVTKLKTASAKNMTTSSNNTLSSCQLKEQFIQCEHARFYRAFNKPNQKLAKYALSSKNTLVLPQQSDPSFAKLPLNRYLSGAYTLYIEKMLEIGLGDGTMSFTKFVAIYNSNQNNSNNFSRRMSKMYEFLKEDKRNNAVKSLYNNRQPESIRACMPLTRTVIVCDNKYQNWIFQDKQD